MTKKLTTQKKIMLIHPPGKIFQRGEDRCQINLEATVSQSLHACNDIGYAASALLNKDYEVKLRDYQGEKASVETLFQDIKEFSPDVISISTTDTTVHEDLQLAKEIKQNFDTKIILKGAIFWDYNENLVNKLDKEHVDFLIGAELENSIVQAVEYLLNGQINPVDIPNSFFKNENNQFVPTTFEKWEGDLDKISFPARHLMKNELYKRPDTGEPIATIQTSRGCSFNCIYCLVASVSGKKVRFRSPQNVFEEIKECYEKHNIKNFFFRSDAFTIDANWVKELCNLIINSSLHKKIEFTANSRVYPLAKETLELMKDAGCFLVAFGFESGSEDTMAKIKKGATVENNRQAMKMAREVGLQVFGMFVIGFPWETKTHINETKKLIHEIKPDFIEVNIAIPFTGTQLYDTCKTNPNFNKNIFGWDFFNPNFSINEYFSTNELMKFRKDILLSYYLSPAYILKKIKFVILNKNHKIILNYIKYGINLLLKMSKIK